MSLTFPALDQIAPQFTTTDQNGEAVSLADFKGKKVVLYFYPKASTPGCTTQACGIRDSKDAFAQANTVVIGISPDATKRLTNFTVKQELNFPLLSDEDNAIAESYGVWAL
jgi:peroxiredoxin Q/BCP